MPVLLHQQPVLTLALDSFQDTTIDESDIRRMWIIFTKCKDDIKNGFRLENISWRIWYKKYLNNTSDLFSNDKIYNKKSAMDNSQSMVHSVDSNSSSFSTIEPIEVLKKCACGEQLISSSLSSLSTPHSEYTCFDKQICIHHHQKSTQEDSSKTIDVENHDTTKAKETVVEVPKDETISIPPTETTTTEEPIISLEEEKEEEEEIEIENENESENENNEIKEEITEEIKENEIEKEKEEVVSTMNTNNSKTTNTTITKDTDKTAATIPPNCPTLEQFYQQQILLLQQVYIQKQQQLQYQKQQMVISQEQMYQHQMYLQQWYNQQQQQLLANCSTYYNKYLQQHFGGQILSQQPQPQQTTTTEPTQPTQPSQPSQQQQPLQSKYVEDDDDYDEDEEDDDDYYYSDEEDDDYNDDDEEYQEEKENVPPVNEKPVKDDLFRKVSTPSLKNKMVKTSLLSAMIKENNYNEYKKTVEIMQKYDDDALKTSNNIYSIKDYNRNCINSLNKNQRRKRAPSFEDVRNARKLFEMHPLYQDPSIQESNGNDDVEEYYEKGHSQFNTTTTTNQNSYSTVNTMASQDSHCTVYSNHSHHGIYGSNKTTHSTHSTKSQGPFLNRASNNNSVNLYMNKKRLNHSN